MVVTGVGWGWGWGGGAETVPPKVNEVDAIAESVKLVFQGTVSP